jgi:hypothetical protein
LPRGRDVFLCGGESLVGGIDCGVQRLLAYKASGLHDRE